MHTKNVNEITGVHNAAKPEDEEMRMTREEAAERGRCKTCAAYLPGGRVKCGAFPLHGAICPRGNNGKVESLHLARPKSGAQRSGTGTIKQGRVEEAQHKLF